MRQNQPPAAGARDRNETRAYPGEHTGTTAAPGPASKILGLNEHKRRQAEILALSGALLTLSARSSTGASASAFATVCLLVILTVGVMWSLVRAVVPEVPPAAPYLEMPVAEGLGLTDAASNVQPSVPGTVETQPDSTASVPLGPDVLSDKPAATLPSAPLEQEPHTVFEAERPEPVRAAPANVVPERGS